MLNFVQHTSLKYMMELLILFLSLTVASARIIENCDGVIIRNVKHEMETLKSGLDGPYQLAIDYDTQTLFFSYTNDGSVNVFTSAYINLKLNEFGTIKGISGGFASAVDSQGHKVYLGGSDGIYAFDFNTKTATRVGAVEYNIWQMFYKGELLFTTYPDEKAYRYKNGEGSEIPELKGVKVMLVAMDSHNNYYFSNSSGLFYKNTQNGKLRNLGDYVLNGISADINGNIYFSTPTGIFYINEELNVIERLVSLNNIYGIAVESDGNIIYSTSNSVVRLKPTTSLCLEENKV